MHSALRVCPFVCLTLLSLTALGCDWIGFSFTRVGAPNTPKPGACSFEVLDAKPSRPFTEVGVLTSTRGCSGEADLRRQVASDVCGAGGDAVVTEMNANKCIMRGTVIRYAPAPALLAHVSSAAAVGTPRRHCISRWSG